MTPDRVDFFVPGIPAPGGSKRAFAHKVTGRLVVTDDARGNRPWRDRVASFARDAWPHGPIRGPLSLTVWFVLPRPRGHFGTGRNAGKVRPSAPAYPATKPDATKLVRALEDAITGILWADDAAIVHQEVAKLYGPVPGARVRVESWAHPATAAANGWAAILPRRAPKLIHECPEIGPDE